MDLNPAVARALRGERVICFVATPEHADSMFRECAGSVPAAALAHVWRVYGVRQEIHFNSGGSIKFVTTRAIGRLRGYTFDQVYVHERVLDSLSSEMLRCELAILAHASGNHFITLTD